MELRSGAEIECELVGDAFQKSTQIRHQHMEVRTDTELHSVMTPGSPGKSAALPGGVVFADGRRGRLRLTPRTFKNLQIKKRATSLVDTDTLQKAGEGQGLQKLQNSTRPQKRSGQSLRARFVVLRISGVFCMQLPNFAFFLCFSRTPVEKNEVR